MGWAVWSVVAGLHQGWRVAHLGVLLGVLGDVLLAVTGDPVVPGWCGGGSRGAVGHGGLGPELLTGGRGRGCRPEHVLDEHPLLGSLQALGVLRIAGAVRHLGRDPLLQVLGIHELLIELEVGGVERLLRGLGEAGPLQGDVLEVLELMALDGHRRGGRIAAVQGPPVLQGGHQRAGLEGGGGPVGEKIARLTAELYAEFERGRELEAEIKKRLEGLK